MLTKDSVVNLVNKNEFTINGPKKVYTFKIANRNIEVQNFIEILNTMILNINKLITEINCGFSIKDKNLF